MSDALTISARFLQPYSHGRGEDGRPEWPPSPLRLFQAVVAGAIGRAVDASARERAAAALKWLERRPAPQIIATSAGEAPMATYRLYVPNNEGDVVARAWSRGAAADISKHRAEKDVRALKLYSEEPAVHYVFQADSELPQHLETLRAAARSMTHLGWGIDMVAGEAVGGEVSAEGERWAPRAAGGRSLRWAVPGTLDQLELRHQQFLHRLEGGVFRPVPPLTAFTALGYARTTDPASRPWAAFKLRAPEDDRLLRLTPELRARDVAAWLRHGVDEASVGWPFGSNRLVVHGHAQHGGRLTGSDGYQARFSYLPLPSITPRSVEAIARCLVVADPSLDTELAWIRGRLAGVELTWADAPVAVLEPIESYDGVVAPYVGTSTHWSTVTPVVLPGHHDGSATKAERLLRKAFLHAGLSQDQVDAIVELEWNDVGFRRGLGRARDYALPDKISGPRFHVRVEFGSPIVGPLAVGSARHRGLGVFAIAAQRER